MPVTIYDIAKKANVSISTVSKALNDSYSISDSKKQEILRIAEELDYKPNARARNFARQRSGIVLFVTDLHRNVAFENPHMYEIVTGISQYLDEKNYSLLIKHVTAKDAPGAIRDMMSQEQADAVIIHAAILSKSLAQMLTHARLPHLVIGKPDFPTTICWMDVNHELAGQEAATYLLDKGYRDMTFLMGDANEDHISLSRQAGMQQVFGEEGLTFRTVCGESTYDAGYRQMNELLGQSKRPEVVLCTNNYLAMGCLQCLREHGIGVPQTVAVMTFDNYPFSMITVPQLTAVEADMYDMGLEAARFILRKIKKPELQTQSYCTVPRLVERAST